MNIRVREAEPRDAAAVVSLIAELAHGAGEESPLDAAYVAEYLATHGSGILLAHQDQTPLGLLSYSVRPNLYHRGGSCLIEELVVSAQARGRGVGSALLAAVLERARQLRCAEISLAAMPGNTRAIALYKRLGFVDEAVLLEKHFTY